MSYEENNELGVFSRKEKYWLLEKNVASPAARFALA